VEDAKPSKPTGDDAKKGGEDKKASQQEDIAEADLHVKARQFLKKSSLTIEHINQLFYKEEGNFLPLYDDLKTTKASESQIRIALLHSLLQGMHTGDFEFNGESVRGEHNSENAMTAQTSSRTLRPVKSSLRFSRLRGSNARRSRTHSLRPHCITWTQQNGVVRTLQDGVQMGGVPGRLPTHRTGGRSRSGCRHRELCRIQESTHALPSLSWFDGDHPLGGCGKFVPLLLWLAMPVVW
jgi:hypothetical protein